MQRLTSTGPPALQTQVVVPLRGTVAQQAGPGPKVQNKQKSIATDKAPNLGDPRLPAEGEAQAVPPVAQVHPGTQSSRGTLSLTQGQGCLTAFVVEVVDHCPKSLKIGSRLTTIVQSLNQ